MKDGRWKLGTGYPIARDLVLTARHVVDFPERDTEKRILLKWTDYQHSFGEKEDENAEIIFNGGTECDIAILRCKIPPQVQVSTSILGRRFPKAHEKWETFGYPEVGVNETTGSHDKDSLLGMFHAPDLANHNINLTTFSQAVDKEDWQGVSGAPVFQGNTLYAVIIKTSKRREEYFKAVSIPYLLKHNEKFCNALKQSDDEAISEQKQLLHKEIKSNVKRLLLKNFSEAVLQDCLEMPDKTIDGIVESLVTGEQDKSASVLDALSVLTIILEKHPPQHLEDVREISGWLLLNSIDPVWWFHNQQRMQQVTGAFNLKKPEYVEVIISRSLLRPAQYARYPEKHGNHPKPCRYDGTDLSILPFDSSSEAIDYQLLRPIYLDLWKIDPPKDNAISSMLEDIMSKARSKLRISKGKMIYYLVENDYLKQLSSREWFAEKEEELADCLRFICCNPKEQSAEQEPCQEGQGDILAQLSDLLEKIDNLAK